MRHDVVALQQYTHAWLTTVASGEHDSAAQKGAYARNSMGMNHISNRKGSVLTCSSLDKFKGCIVEVPQLSLPARHQYQRDC
jgi:hypothetical protein